MALQWIYLNYSIDTVFVYGIDFDMNWLISFATGFSIVIAIDYGISYKLLGGVMCNVYV